MNDIINFSEYRDWLHDLKQQIKTEQIKAVLSVNSRMIMLYWDMGRQIAEKQEKARWGSGFIELLSKDLKEEFPEETGFSYDNLRFIRRFYLFYSQISEQLVPKIQSSDGKENIKSKKNAHQLQSSVNHYNENINQVVQQLVSVPWGHHILLLKKVKDLDKAFFYINKTIKNNWSRAVLEYHIETNLYGCQGKAITNFSLTLPAPQSDLANELMKSPYNLAFIRMSEKVREINLAIGVSTFNYTELADEMKAALPSEEKIQNELLNFEREHGKK